MRGFPIALSVLPLVFLSGIYGNQLSGRIAVDVCADVDAGLDVLGILFGIINVCICISTLDVFVEANVVAIAAVDLLGEDAVIAELTVLIGAAPDHQSCSYPDHSVAQCIPGNPCGFTCNDGFVPSPSNKPTQCICPSPYVVCNGVCTKGPCPSSSWKKRDLHYWAKASVCPNGLTACGVYGGSSRAWECVDTLQDLESCGGCSLSIGPFDENPRGVDCTSLHGVSDVSCQRGKCVIHRCLPEFEKTVDGESCIRDNHHSSDLGFIPAFQYGLEHIPIFKD